MKKLSYIVICLFISAAFLASCSDVLDASSDRLATAAEYGHSDNDSLYSTFGVLSQLQKLGDKYVILGELRGDLMDVSDKADVSLQEINNFSISSNNPYVKISDYYAVINNCNYILKNIDSSKVVGAQKLKLREYAAIKSIRAWTYMQIALNFKTAKYYVDPILTIEDAKKTYPEYGIDELADILIADIAPLKDVQFPNIGYIASYNTSYSYFPIRFLLGDLYLWKGDYNHAAKEYYDLIFKNNAVISKDEFISSWTAINGTITKSATFNWLALFQTGSSETISTITCPTQYGQHYDLDSLSLQQKLVPSKVSLKNWIDQTYYLNEASNTQGDLRMYGSIWWKNTQGAYTGYTNTFSTTDQSAGSSIFILKYLLYNQNVIVYRKALLYLRYAEAINRLNKPNMAFAILKYGLTSTNCNNAKIVPKSEKDSITSSYTNFNYFKFSNNVGIRMRALGNADKDTTFYTIKKQNTMKDSVIYVENMIQKELALETAFEGNRFHDLMRITFRRIKNGEDDESYLANLVASKHTSNATEIKAKLMNTDNWYLKK